jgi:hypothetical protein
MFDEEGYRIALTWTAHDQAQRPGYDDDPAVEKGRFIYQPARMQFIERRSRQGSGLIFQ